MNSDWEQSRKWAFAEKQLANVVLCDGGVYVVFADDVGVDCYKERVDFNLLLVPFEIEVQVTREKVISRAIRLPAGNIGEE
jgi:hypothetical protein